MLHVTVPQLPGARVRSRRGGEAWQVSVRGLATLQRLAVISVGSAALTELDLDVTTWKPPIEGWLGSPGLAGLTVVAIEPSTGGVHVRLGSAQPIDASLLLSAAVRCLRPVATGDRAAQLTFAPALTIDAAPLGGSVRDVLLDGQTRDRHVRRCDTLVVSSPEDAPGVERSSTVVIGRDEWVRDGMSFEVCVDPTVHRPVGRRSTGTGTVASGTVSGTRLTITVDGNDVSVEHDVTAANVRALRTTSAVVCSDALPVRIARQLAACGVIVTDEQATLPEATDTLDWQARSVAGRRHALRQYGPTPALGEWPSVSVVLCTNRPDHLEQAMRQLAGLRYPSLEIIVGAHGPSVDPARVWDLGQDVPHPVTVVAVDAACTLGEALQSCSDRAAGTLITKMDDDDIYGPEHVWDLVLARQYSGAQIVGKALDWIHLESADATVFRPVFAAEKYADFVAGGTMLISRGDLMSVGGWRPVPKSVDRALLDRVLAEGGLVYRAHGLGYVYARHSAGHTATVSDEHFLTRIEGRFPGLIAHEAFGTAVPS